MTDMTTADATPTGDDADDVATGDATRHLGWALVLICTAQLMVVLDSTIANIALPFIGRDLEVTPGNLQWVVTGYALAFGGLLLLGGRLGDLYGRRRVFMVGLTIFAVASGLGGLAQNEGMLLASRGLQGLGAALAAPAALALITTTFPAGPRRNQAFSVYAAMSGVGAAIGLLLGGWLTGLNPSFLGNNIEGWRLTFLINVPIGLVAALAAPRLLKESATNRGIALDLPGAITGTLGLVSLVYGITRAGDAQYGWSDGGTLGFIFAGVALLAAFVTIERKVTNPLLPLRILANRTRATAFIAMMIVPAAMFAMFFFLSQFIQNVMGYTPLQAGLAFLPFPFAMVIGATISSKLMNKLDPRFLAGTGTILAGIALLNFHRLSVETDLESLRSSIAAQLSAGQSTVHIGTDINYWASIFPFVALMAFGMSLTFIPLTLSAVHHVKEEDSGIASGVLNTMQQVGGALGLATLATIATHFSQNKATELFASLGSGSTGGDPATIQAATEKIIGQAAFTTGGTSAFLVGAFMIWTASLILWIFLDVSHEEMATDGPAPAAAH